MFFNPDFYIVLYQIALLFTKNNVQVFKCKTWKMYKTHKYEVYRKLPNVLFHWFSK